jgi:hypothetical protein
MTDTKAKDGFMSLRESRERLGVSKVKMIQLVRESGVKLYDDPLDKRKKLIRREDLDKLTQPVPRGAG